MTTLSYTNPTLGSNNSTEDPLIRTALSDIKTAYNTDHAAGGHALDLLASGSASQIIVCNASGVPTYVTQSGDVSVSQAGAFALTAGAVVDADVNASAAIQGSKLDTTDGRLKQTTGIVSSSSPLTTTTSYSDITGATVTFTPDVACHALVAAQFMFSLADLTSGDTCSGEGTLTVDGAAETRTAEFSIDGSPAGLVELEASVTQFYRVSLSVASHTLKLQAKKTVEGAEVIDCRVRNAQFLYFLVAQ